MCAQTTTSGSACRVTVDKENRRIWKSVNRHNQGIENGHDKLWHEAEFIMHQNLINEYYPLVKDIHYEDEDLVVEYEYLFQGLTMADLIFDSRFSISFLKQSLENIAHALFNSFYVKTRLSPNPEYLYNCYFDRLRRRIDRSLELIHTDFQEWTRLKTALTQGIFINETYYPPIADYLDYLLSDNQLQQQIMIHNCYNAHHDLIPENIMVDVQDGLTAIRGFRLIDPRGDAETGLTNRHPMYDMGKMLFGLDCYGLFRRAMQKQDFSNFKYFCHSENRYTLVFHTDHLIVQRLMYCQHLWMDLLKKQAGNDWLRKQKQYALAFAFMYHPDIPCRIIAEQNEDLCLLFYLRGMMVLRYCLKIIFGRDPLTNDFEPAILWAKE
jgi:hypothetical protein